MSEHPIVRNFNIQYPNFSIEFGEGYRELLDFYQRGETSTKKYFTDIIKPDWQIVDVGANIGMMTLLFSKLASEGTVLAIEASGQNFDMLKNNIAKYGMSNIKPVNAYISDVDSEENGEIHYLWTGRGSVARQSGRFNFNKLDTIITNHAFKPNLIKIDIDGYDFEAVKGCTDTLEKYSPILLVELVDEALALHGNTKTDVIQFLKTLGYEETAMFDHCNYIFQKA